MNENIDYLSIANSANSQLDESLKVLSTYSDCLTSIIQNLVNIEGNVKEGMNNYIEKQNSNIIKCRNTISNIKSGSISKANSMNVTKQGE